jgi:hypothetical protein
MSEAILEWLGGSGVGSSSKVIALTALGAMPKNAHWSYPHDGADFGRCHRLLELAPVAKGALATLAESGGPYWKALVARWPELTASYTKEPASHSDIYQLMRSILDPIEKADRSVVRVGPGVTMRFGG